MTQSNDRHEPEAAADEKREPTNVELQFMGHVDEREELNARVEAESSEAGAYKLRGLDEHDVAVRGTQELHLA
ncbi:M-like protein [Deinococcus aerophilus]|uniref:Uncharacterized protein n=1 Tax=Deinococcus aerophilus TaxID=522488 RepID=A0ABQ2H1R9_9DEIO|nr:M-like protein [Deinococcus aerophilus]GGM22717.1 hypothetical protein GCM10010841_33180 [Deinococcus aerophilus]